MELNIKLFNKVIEHILEEPKRLRQNCWIEKKRLNKRNFDMVVGLGSGAKEPPCGTVACVAGWASQLSSKRRDILNDESISTHALRVLVIGDDEEAWEARENLHGGVFHYFPPETLNPGTVKYAKSVVSRIKRFIKQNS